MMNKYIKYFLLSIWALALIFLVIIVGYVLMDKYKQDDISWTLNSNKGEVSLSDFKDKVVLIYFGFTHCPDICPTSLYLMSDAYKKLTKKEQSQVQLVFISVDPKRDTPKILYEYSKYFNKNIIGLTGNKDLLDNITQKYNAFYRFVPTPKSTLKYTVSHTTKIYIIDKVGKLQLSLDPHKQDVEYLIESIKSLI